MTELIQRWLRYRRACRTYRALCREGRAPHVRYHVYLHPDDQEWTGLHGVTGVKRPAVPLTRRGVRLIARDAKRIRATCINQLIRDEQQRDEAASP
ncbi:hypothetical protein ACQEU3_47005 [Spirillospora sp. CA-253888]